MAGRHSFGLYGSRATSHIGISVPSFDEQRSISAILGALDDKIAARAVALRKQHRIRLPDAVIWASAQTHNMLLVTRNTKDFPPGDPAVRMPYYL